MQQFAAEIAFFQANTDGLVIDDMRNPGGSVGYLNSLMQYLMPTPFQTVGFEVRATSLWVENFSYYLQQAKATGAEQWIIDTYQGLLNGVVQANSENRGRTGPLPNESARAQYLASEEARRGVIVSLIADVADSYFTLRERDLELEIARSTREIAARNMELVRTRHDRGAVSALDVHQAEQFLYIASAQIASTERDIGQTENALSLLLGRPPGEIVRGGPTDDFGLPPELPAGLPSSLLEHRPDIRGAEQKLIAANAQIGAAKAYYFPQISLTGFLGGQSRALTDLFTGPARSWATAPTASLPIFNAGQVRVAVRLTEAQKREMVAAYQKAIYNAFREVSDALIGYHDTREQRRQQDQLVHALQETSRLSNLRYQGGMDSYLQVLDSERTLFQGRLSLAQLRLRELLSFVQLYRALGGGWQ